MLQKGRCRQSKDKDEVPMILRRQYWAALHQGWPPFGVAARDIYPGGVVLHTVAAVLLFPYLGAQDVCYTGGTVVVVVVVVVVAVSYTHLTLPTILLV